VNSVPVNTKLTETSRRGLESVNPRLIGQYHQLTALLGQRLGADHAFLLAEPEQIVIVEGGSNTDLAWFVDGDTGGLPITALDAAEAQRLRLRYRSLAEDILRFADQLEAGNAQSLSDMAKLLRDALNVPDESQSLWSVDGRPVVVNWGYKRVAEGTLISDPSRLVGENKSRSEGLKAAGMAEHEPPPSPPEPQVVSRSAEQQPRTLARRIIGSFLWLVLVCQLVWIGDLLLRACGIGGVPWPASLRPWLPNYCALAGPAGSDISQMEASLQDREMALVRKIAACGPDCPPQKAPTDPVERAIQGNDLPRGRVEVTLAWDSLSDLDLHVRCGTQVIFYQVPKACGGELVSKDLNSNKENLRPNPIEHVIWDQMPPRARYTVYVNTYAYRGGDGPGRLTYTVRLSYRFDDGTTVILKEAKNKLTIQEGKEDEAFVFTSPITPPAHP